MTATAWVPHQSGRVRVVDVREVEAPFEFIGWEENGLGFIDCSQWPTGSWYYRIHTFVGGERFVGPFDTEAAADLDIDERFSATS